MQNRRFTQDHPEKVTSLQPKNFIRWLNQLFKNRKQLGVVAIGAAFLVVLLIAISLTLGNRPARSESYADVSGAAGLSATIAYSCPNDCDNKYNFNVYILTPDGRQVSTVQPNADGEVKMAMPEGDYVMLIGKLFDNYDTFPQEPLELKNGKTLELKLQY